MNITKNKLAGSILLALAGGVLSACGGSSGNDNNDDPESDITGNVTGNTGEIITKQVNATAGGFGAQPDDPINKYTYFNLATEAVVELTDNEAATSSDWHIAFKRTNFKLNGGVSGPVGVKGAVADSQDDFYDAEGEPNNSVFLNANAESEQAALDAVLDVNSLSSSLKEDSNTPYIKSDGSSDAWWLYAGPPTHAVSANSDKWWLIKSAEGDSYAKINVTDIVQVSRDISLDIFIQGATDSLFSTTAISWTAAIGDAGGSKCFDIDAAIEMDCTTAAADWDIKVEVTDRDWNIWTNGGVFGEDSGGAFGSFDTAGAATYVSGSVNPGGDNLSRFYQPDSVGGLFKGNTWYAYNLEGNNKLWPNYRVYAIDTGAVQYKLQVLSYYDDTGTSGMIKFRYERL